MDDKNYTTEYRRIMYLDMAYTMKMVRERELQQELSSRNSGGYFEHVWGVHPMADIPEGRTLAYDGFKPDVVEFSQNQTIIEGVSAYYSLLKKIFPLNFLVSQIRFVTFLIRLVKKEKISIVLCTEPYFCGLLGLAIKIFTKARLVIWVVANNDDIYKATGVIAMPRLYKWRWVEKIIEKIVYSNADLVAGGNQNNLEYALRNGAKVHKSTVFPVGKLIHSQHLLDIALREKDDFFSKSNATYHFIYVGRLTEVKHPDDVIKAFALIDEKIPGCALLMAGDGPLKESLQKLVSEKGLTGKVHFMGNVNQLRLANLLAGCYVVLSPLTGRSLIESALAGLPIVAYDRDWQVEFVEKNGAGVIVPFRDWNRMAEEALEMINFPARREQMGNAARAAGLQAIDLDKIYAHEKKEFEKLLQ